MFQTKTEHETEESDRKKGALWLTQSEIQAHKVKAIFTLLLLSICPESPAYFLLLSPSYLSVAQCQSRSSFVDSYDDDKYPEEFSLGGRTTHNASFCLGIQSDQVEMKETLIHLTNRTWQNLHRSAAAPVEVFVKLRGFMKMRIPSPQMQCSITAICSCFDLIMSGFFPPFIHIRNGRLIFWVSASPASQ